MAAAISLGVSALTFIDLVGQLSKHVITFFDSIKDASADIIRVSTRLRDLEQILIQIGRVRSQWNDKFSNLRTIFAEFQDVVKKWESNRGPGGRTRWFLSYESKAQKFLLQLAEDIEVVKSLHLLMMESFISSRQSSYLEQTLRQAQSPLALEMTRVSQTMENIQIFITSKQGFARPQRLGVHIQQRHLQIGRSTPAKGHRGKSFAFVSSVIMKYATYHLPMGTIEVQYEIHGGDEDNEYQISGRWIYDPPKWLYGKAFTTDIILHMRYGAELPQPSIAPTLSTQAVIPNDHPVWDAIYIGDFVEFQAMFQARMFRVNDVDKHGLSGFEEKLIIPFVDVAFNICGVDQSCSMEMANKILLALISDFPDVPLVASFTTILSNRCRSSYINLWSMLRYSDNNTIGILDRAGVNPDITRYARIIVEFGRFGGEMLSNDLLGYIDEGMDSKVLNWLLFNFSSDPRDPIQLIDVLLQKGANVNYVEEDENYTCDDWPSTPLGQAVSVGNIKVVQLLLDHGAYVLLGTGNGYLSQITRWEKLGKPWLWLWPPKSEVFQSLVDLLEPLERKELARIGLQLPDTQDPSQ
ncbi:hypothetical protein BDD12DRAFT_803135 [Trichophaea hybrida]|nr:hypothetical protein BDD12DRAFT_803135 [Trichophaea hybrida]